MRVSLAMLREGANMTQTQISQCADISQGYYSDIESGVRCPSPDVAVRIAKVLNIPESDIFRVFYAEARVKRSRRYAG
jgi:transcriptional regulator with XRE-family HTH domain